MHYRIYFSLSIIESFSYYLLQNISYHYYRIYFILSNIEFVSYYLLQNPFFIMYYRIYFLLSIIESISYQRLQNLSYCLLQNISYHLFQNLFLIYYRKKCQYIWKCFLSLCIYGTATFHEQSVEKYVNKQITNGRNVVLILYSVKSNGQLLKIKMYCGITLFYHIMIMILL